MLEGVGGCVGVEGFWLEGVGGCVWVLECGGVREDWRGVGVYGCWRVEVMCGVGGEGV